MSNCDSLTLDDYKLICQNLHKDKMKMLEVRQNFLVLNEKDEITSKSLLKLKNDYEQYKSNLYKTLFSQKVATDKQIILLQKKLDEFSNHRKKNEEYLKFSPILFQLEELIKQNNNLLEECNKKTDLLMLTKQQYNKLLIDLMEKFKQKVCEFCRIVFEYKENYIL